MPRVFVPQLNRHVVFPDGMSTSDMRREIERLIGQQEAVQEGPSNDPLKALWGGVRAGFSLAPEALGKASGLIGGAVPGEDPFETGRDWLAEMAEKTRGDFVPDTLAEKVAYGLGQAPGTIAAIAPIGAAMGAAVGAAPAWMGLGGAAGALAAGAGTFGAFEALMASDQGAAEAAKAGLKGAALGAAFGGASRLAGYAKAAKGPMAGRGTHAAALGGLGAGAAALEGAPTEDIVAQGLTFAGLGAAASGELPGFRKFGNALGISDAFAKELTSDVKTMKKAGATPKEINEYIEQRMRETYQTAEEIKQQDVFNLGPEEYNPLGRRRPTFLKEWEQQDPFVHDPRIDDSFFNKLEKLRADEKARLEPGWTQDPAPVGEGKIKGSREAGGIPDPSYRDYWDQIPWNTAPDPHIPSTSKRPFPPRIKQPTKPRKFRPDEPISAVDVAQAISDVFGVELRTGSMAPGELGWYHSPHATFSGGIVHTLDLHGIGTILHEVGHHIHRVLQSVIAPEGSKKTKFSERMSVLTMEEGAVPEAARMEMLRAVEHKYGGAPPYADAGLYAEGFAEFFAEAIFYGLGKGSRAAKEMPVTTEWFIGVLKNDPKLYQKVQYSKDLVRRWSQQPPEKMMEANIADRPTAVPGLDFRDAWPWLRQKFIESGDLIKKLVDDAPFTPDPLEDPYALFRFGRGSHSAQMHAAMEWGVHNYVKGGTDPISKGVKQILAEHNINRNNYGEFKTYLVSKSMGEVIDKVFFGTQGPLSQKALSAIEKRNPGWEKAAKDFNEIGNALLKVAVDGGVLPKKVLEQAQSDRKYWVPLQRWIEQNPLGKDVFRSLTGGSGQKIVDPIIGLANVMERTFNSINHARSMNSLVKFLTQFDEHGVEIVHPKDVSRNYRYLDDAHIIRSRYKGKNIYYRLPRDVFNAVKNSEAVSIPNKLADLILGGPKRMVTLGYTGLNVGFQFLTNPLRDLYVRSLQTKEGQPGWSGGLQGQGKAIQTSMKALPEVLAVHFYGKDPSPEYRRYMASGAKIAGPVWNDLRNAVAMRDHMLTHNVKDFGAEMVQHPIEVARRLLSWSEDVNRLPEYKLAEKAYGAGTPEAYLMGQVGASDVTLDFRRMGQYGRWINEFIPFWNASVQGADKFARTVKEDPGAAFARATMSVTAPMMILWGMNKDEEWYQELPTWEKMVFAHFKIGDKVVRLPLPFEWGIIFGSLPVSMLDAQYQQSPDRVKDSVRQALETLSPDFFPTALKIPVELISNKDMFRDVPIESRAMQRLLPEDRFRASTPSMWKALGKATGLSPVKLQHLAEGFTGGIARDATRLMDFPAKAMRGEVSTIETMPVIGRMFSNLDRPGQSVNDFYERVNKVEKIFNSAKASAQAGDKRSAEKLLVKNHKLLGITEAQARAMSRQRNMKTPLALKRLRSVARKMSEMRKEDEPDIMTEMARRALGRY